MCCFFFFFCCFFWGGGGGGVFLSLPLKTGTKLTYLEKEHSHLVEFENFNSSGLEKVICVG